VVVVVVVVVVDLVVDLEVVVDLVVVTGAAQSTVSVPRTVVSLLA
jgi:hypothetical protein